MNYLKHGRAGELPTALIDAVQAGVHVEEEDLLAVALREPVPASVEAHVVECARCHEAVRRLRFADALLRRTMSDD